MSDKSGHDDPFSMSEASKELERKFLNMSAGIADSMGPLSNGVDENIAQSDHSGIEGSDNVDGPPVEID